MTSILSNLSEGTKMSGVEANEGIDLPAVFEEAGQLVLQGRSNIRFAIRAPQDLPTITGDQRKLSQMARFFFEESRST